MEKNIGIGIKKTILGVLLISIVVFSITFTYSFFIKNIDQSKGMSTSLKTGNMALTFEDNDNGINKQLSFGETVTKKFKIINTGNVDASLSLDWNMLVNTYLNRSLSYNLKYSTEENGTYEEIVPETNMPTSTTPIKQALASELTVPSGSTYYYNLEITLNDLKDVEQSDDLDAVFNTKFDIGEPSKYRYYRLTIDTNGGSFEEEIQREYLLKNEETVSISNTPTRPGYTFAGWKVQGLSSKFVDGTFTMGLSDTYLIAQWTPNKYILTLNDTCPSRLTQSLLPKVTYQNKTPIKVSESTQCEGYTFTGWTADGGKVEGNETDGYTFTLTETRDASITNNWKINNYKYIVYHNKQNISDNKYTLVSADTDEGEAEFNTTVTPPTKEYGGFTPPSTETLTIKHETVYPPVLNKVDYNYDRNRYTLTIDPNGGTYNGLADESQVSMLYEESSDIIHSGSVQETLSALKITSNGVKSSFDTVATSNEGVFEMADDYGTSYYYRGAVTNNYVKFGGFYWRIIRINGDGSVRMIYDGTKAHTNGETGDENDRFINPGVAYNGSFNDNAYVGWMYGIAGSSTYSATHTNTTDARLKMTVDTWYKTNIADKGLGTYVSDEIFCNDRNIPGKSVTGWSSDTGRGFGTNATAYGATGRFVDVSSGSWLPRTNQQPKFTCTQKNDAFTVSDTTKGNGSLSYPVGLIMADEIVAAGAKFQRSDGTSNNTSYYLYRNKWYWSLSPSYMEAGGGARVFSVYMDGSLGRSDVYAPGGGVAPVINISAEYAKTMTGTGVIGDEYEIPMEKKTISVPMKTGYTFTEWTKSSGNGILTPSTFTMVDSDTRIIANYTSKEYFVVFNANGGSTTTGSKTVKYDSAYGELPTPTYEGYTFEGWYTEANGGTKVTSTTMYTTADNTTLYAHWRRLPGVDTTMTRLGLTKKTEPLASFATAATTDETADGLYPMEDDYGTSYYFRGNVENNYVKFGGFYWRIIRINGDGSVRMIYDGTKAHTNGDYSSDDQFIKTDQVWNSWGYVDNKYVGWMFGGTNGEDSTSLSQAQANETNSDIKTVVDEWYKTNIADKGLGQYVGNEIFCNDRSMSAAPGEWWADEGTSNRGFGSTRTAYGAFSRFVTTDQEWNTTNPSPKFTCDQKNDRFTTSADTVNGNGELLYPVGLITADEFIASGGSGETSGWNHYLSRRDMYWTMSPYYSKRGVYVFCINGGDLDVDSLNSDVTSENAVAPVINLSAEAAATLRTLGTQSLAGSSVFPYYILGAE